MFHGVRQITRHRGFMSLAVSESLSRFGDLAQGTALTAYVYILTQKPIFVGVFLFLRFAPEFLLASLAGNVADRFRRKYVATIVNFSMAILSMLLIVFHHNVYAVLTISMVSGIVFLPYRPALNACLPTMLSTDELASGNAFLNSLTNVGRIGGAVLASYGLLENRETAIFLFNAITFVISALVTWLVLPPSSTTTQDDTESPQKSRSTMECLKFLASNISISHAVIGSTLLWGSVALSDVLLVPVLGAQVTGGERYYGYYRLIATIGMLIGSVFSPRWRRLNTNYSVRSFLMPILVISLSTALLALYPLSVGFLMYFLIWIAVFLPSTILDVYTQSAPEEMRSKVVAITEGIDGILFSIISIILPLFANTHNGKSLLFILSLCFSVASTIWGISTVISRKRGGTGSIE